MISNTEHLINTAGGTTLAFIAIPIANLETAFIVGVVGALGSFLTSKLLAHILVFFKKK